MNRQFSWHVAVVTFLISLTLSVFSLDAIAQGGPRGATTVPSIPRASTVFRVEMNAYNCDAFWGGEPWDREITVSGSSITVRVPYTPPFSGAGCDFGNPYRIFWYVGPLQAGQYSLTVLGVDPISGDVGTIEITIPVTVIDNVSPSVVPTQSMYSLMFLTLLVGLLGLMAARRI